MGVVVLLSGPRVAVKVSVVAPALRAANCQVSEPKSPIREFAGGRVRVWLFKLKTADWYCGASKS